MLEVLAIIIIIALCYAIVLFGTNLVVNRGVKPVTTIADEDFAFADTSDISPDLHYHTKFHYFVQLCNFSRNGMVTVPSWKTLGENEAERARNLLLIKENNIRLRIEETGEEILPETGILAHS